MLNQTSHAFAQWCRDYAAYLGGSEYGHSDLGPKCPAELSEPIAGYVRRLIGNGRQAAIARGQGDEARAAFARESVAKLRPLLSPNFSADVCWGCGYSSYADPNWKQQGDFASV
jgi:hypothetical protein